MLWRFFGILWQFYENGWIYWDRAAIIVVDLRILWRFYGIHLGFFEAVRIFPGFLRNLSNSVGFHEML